MEELLRGCGGNVTVENDEVGEVSGFETALLMFAKLGEGGGLSVCVDGFVRRDFFLRLKRLGAGFVLAGDRSVESAEGVDGLHRVVGSEGEGDVVVEEALPGVGVLCALGAETVCGPLHVGEEVGGLHGGDDTLAREAIEVFGKQDLGVFYAEAEGGGGGVGWGWGGDDVGVGGVRGWRGEGGDLVGGAEGIEGHRVGTVADGVEAQLEACGGALGG